MSERLNDDGAGNPYWFTWDGKEWRPYQKGDVLLMKSRIVAPHLGPGMSIDPDIVVVTMKGSIDNVDAAHVRFLQEKLR